MRSLPLDEALKGIARLKAALVVKGEATDLFGQLRGDGLASALATIDQGFGDELFYPNVATRAAHLLYFVIKNHPLADGNKRIVTMMTGAESIRDVIAFPKTQRAQCLLTDAPSGVDEKQLRELHIRLRQKVETQVEVSQG